MKRRTDIQVLRAISVLAVILFHYQPDWLPGGYLGVDVFFVISGFLITGILLRKLDGGSLSLWEFYQRRINRIFPALGVMLLTTLVLGVLAFPPMEYQALFEHLPWASVQVANFSFMRNTGYFDADANESAVLHTWSLGVEEQFYLLWAPMLFLIFSWVASRGHPHRGIFRIILTGIVLSFFLDLFLQQSGRDRISFYSPITRAWELGAGCLLACVRAVPPGRFRGGLSLAGILLILVSFALPAELGGIVSQVMAVSGAVLVIFGDSPVFQSRERWFAPLRTIGDWSYSLYLWHFPILIFFPFVFFLSPERGFGLVLSAILIGVMSGLSYRFVERPVLSLRGAVAKKSSLALLLAHLVLAGGSFALMSEQTGEWRFAGEHGKSGGEIPPALRIPEGARPGQGNEGNAVSDAVTRSTECDVVLLGDSHAIHYYPAVKNWCNRRGLTLEFFHRPAFLVAGTGLQSEVFKLNRRKSHHDHDPQARFLLEELSANPRVKFLFIAQRTGFYFFPPLPADRDRYTNMLTTVKGGEADAKERYRGNLEEFAGVMNAAGKTVILLGQVPPLKGHPKTAPTLIEALFRREADDSPMRVRGEEAKRSAFETELYRSLAENREKVLFFDPSSRFPSHLDETGGLLYHDDDHLSDLGALRLVEPLEAFLGKDR